jgi:small subunit ribosomal protein S11
MLGMKKANSFKKKKMVAAGIAHVSASFNNIIVSISDMQGEVIVWSSAGSNGFKGSKKSTPYAAQITAEKAAKKALEFGLKTIAVRVTGPGSGRDSAIRALANDFTITLIKDTTPVPHNGCKPRKLRRM